MAQKTNLIFVSSYYNYYFCYSISIIIWYVGGSEEQSCRGLLAGQNCFSLDLCPAARRQDASGDTTRTTGEKQGWSPSSVAAANTTSIFMRWSLGHDIPNTKGFHTDRLRRPGTALEWTWTHYFIKKHRKRSQIRIQTGLGILSFQKNATFSRSFVFFAK